MQRHILVTGANGFVGRALCCELQNGGFYVRGVLRRAIKSVSAGTGIRGNNVIVEGRNRETITVGNIGPLTDWTSALAGVDTVIHLASRAHVIREAANDPEDEYQRVNAAGTERLAIMAADAGVRRFIYASSVKVNGERTLNAPFTENGAPHPEDAYGRSKLEAENALHRVAGFSKLEVVIVRPPLIYGPGVKGNFLRLIGLVARGVPLPLASVVNRRSLVFIGNLVDAIIACAESPAAPGNTYLVSDSEDVSTPGLIRSLAAALGVHARLFPCPVALLKFGAALLGKGGEAARLMDSLQVDSTKIRRQLGWQPRCTLAHGLAATARWYHQQPDSDTRP